MCEASGHPQLPPVIFREFNGYMPREGRTAYPDVDSHIEYPAAYGGYELSLRSRILDM
jgi:hypothetical protein